MAYYGTYCECHHPAEGKTHNWGGKCEYPECLCEGVEYQQEPGLKANDSHWVDIAGMVILMLAVWSVAFACFWHWKP